MSDVSVKYRRVMLKLSGEEFGGGRLGVDPDVVSRIAREIASVSAAGFQIAVVIGGGNFFRGSELQQRGMDRARADYIGMLGTVMNCLALQDFLEREHHIDLVPVVGAQGHAIGRRAVDAKRIETSYRRPLVRERARRGNRMRGRGHFHVWRHDADLSEPLRGRGERRDAWTVDAVVIGHQNSHDAW